MITDPAPHRGRFPEGRFAEGRFTEGRFAEGRFTERRFAEGRFAEGMGRFTARGPASQEVPPGSYNRRVQLTAESREPFDADHPQSYRP